MHLVRALGLHAIWLVAVLLACSGCFQMTTVVKVAADGSGTIDQQMVMTTAALAQLQQFAAFAGGRGQSLDFMSEDEARATASKLGPGVTYVSSRPIETADGRGRAATYAFTDISQLRINESPDAPGGMGGPGANAQGVKRDRGSITCSLTQEPGGNTVLHINLPEPNLPGAPGGDSGDAGSGPLAPMAQQLALVRALLAGARVSVAVEPMGRLVRTSSPYVDANRVTLLDVDLDQLLGNEAVMTRLQGAKTAEDLKAAIKDVPGVKVNLDREVTIEFEGPK